MVAGNGNPIPLSFSLPLSLSLSTASSFLPAHPRQIFNGLHWCHRGISVAKALKGLKSVAC